MEIKPFYVMEILEKAKELERKGKEIIHFEVGEPDLPVPEKVKKEAIKALNEMEMKYTESTGILPLKEKITEYYCETYGVNASPEQVIITPGSSPALLAVLKVIGEKLGEIAYTDPGYPCYKNMLNFLKVKSRKIDVRAENGFEIPVNEIESPAMIINSPANPTGKILSRERIKKLSEKCFLISDEIYHGLTYGKRAISALEVTEECCVVGGFSKFFLMTGWRVGWVIVPKWMVKEITAILQNIVISPPTVSQIAALKCFDEEVLEELKENVKVFEKRRNLMLKGIQELGFKVPVKPEGAFYIYADCSKFSNDSYSFTSRILEKAGVAITPGIDFGENETDRFVRFSYCTDENKIEKGLEKLYKHLK
ncbi:Aspartate/methionine/tyrosine aminotransferase [Desulfurobacterium pacificum]|uniref:Aminotransferase n=1 Tax=Desulfurobacterium pacificum TaxID=240166 RepID=A0ABY1NSE1_9BACT|nr:aminotransferase class I/II-fold pyridoxal phosphate-dependent enzyme [Desulfurobacterium pacificum]SMP16989.1 Aspartate/methionine/tyrosine aminotransferase [Desulfurobacterium pacificum]